VREAFIQQQHTKPENLRKLYNSSFNISEGIERNGNSIIIKADQSIKNLEDVKKLIHEYISLTNEIKVIMNDTKMSETLQEKSRKIVREHNIPADSAIIQTVLDNSYSEESGGKTLRKKNKRRISKKKKSRSRGKHIK
jgi:hypothetical protein